jgi:two-component system cell cycle response regulator
VRVLIAHARAPVRAEIRARLASLGAEIREAGDAHTALAEFSAWAPDVALVDIELCRRDNVRLLSEFKADPAGWATAVILIARDIDPGAAERELSGGAYDFLLEPIRPGELIARVQAAARTKQLQEELLAQSRRMEAQLVDDFLTGVHNRRFTFAQLAALLSGARRHGRSMSVLMIDIDKFKAINDTHGHAAGDRILTAVARTIRDRIRAEDYVGRVGGEEFLVLLPDAGALEAARVAEDIRQRVSDVAVHVRGTPVRATVSIGWATTHGGEDVETPEELLRRADWALYEAKADGRDTVRAG